jgi:hypothetical protein
LQELEDGPWSQANVDAGSSKIIPVPHPLGGAIVLGESVLSYFNTQHATRSTQIKPNTSIQVRTCRHVLLACVYHSSDCCCTLFGINWGFHALAGASARAQEPS